MLKWMALYIMWQCSCLASSGQALVDTAFIEDFELPYVLRVALEKTGAGMEISPNNTLTVPTASFPFNTGTNVGLFASYKFINLSISRSLRSKTSNKSLEVATNIYNGATNFGGKIGLYNNVAAVQDKHNLKLRSSISLFKLSPYWLLNTNPTRFSLPAAMDYAQRQRRSAGAFMFEINPFYLNASGKKGLVIPADNTYKALFNDMAGLQKLTIINLDFRPGYMYTKVFEEGWFVSGGLFLGPGFGYHFARAETARRSGLHWQSSLRITGSAGYNSDQFFAVAAFRYTNSFTPVSSAGVLADEGSFMLTFGLRLEAFEDKLPKTWKALLGR